jgi:hypothetical protein
MVDCFTIDNWQLKQGGIFYDFLVELENGLCPDTVTTEGKPFDISYVGSVGTNLFINAKHDYIDGLDDNGDSWHH